MRPGPRNVSRCGDTRDGEWSRTLRCFQVSRFGFEGRSCRAAKASRSPLCVAAETAWGPFRLSSAGERVGVGDAVLTVTLVAFSPMDRAASSNWASASRNLHARPGTRREKRGVPRPHWPAGNGCAEVAATGGATDGPARRAIGHAAAGSRFCPPSLHPGPVSVGMRDERWISAQT